MARSIPLSVGFADTFAPTAPATAARPLLSRAIDWLTRSRQRGTEREIAQYLKTLGVDHMTDSIEREIEMRFLSHQTKLY